MFRMTLLGVVLLLPAVTHGEEKRPDWVAPMAKVHEKFTGKKGTLALFGDSITVSRAFWANLPFSRKNMDESTKADYELVRDRKSVV